MAYRHALYPTDFSAASLDSLRRVIGTLPRMRYTLLHACRVAGEGSMRMAGVSDAVREGCRRRAERTARAAGHRFMAQLPPCDVRLVLVSGRPWTAAVAAHAALARPDLLVLDGIRGGILDRWRWSARLRALSRQTGCDLLLLPHARAD